MGIVLASASPRRVELLQQIACDFSVVVSNYEEASVSGLTPEELAMSHALGKAKDVARQLGQDDIIIGADTIVTLNGKMYGKPRTPSHALEMLKDLRGRRHQVITGIAVIRGEHIYQDRVITEVRMKNASDGELARYLDTGEPLDKAGAYGIQGRGALLVEEIQGCYYNVVGLPLTKLAYLMHKVGVTLL